MCRGIGYELRGRENQATAGEWLLGVQGDQNAFGVVLYAAFGLSMVGACTHGLYWSILVYIWSVDLLICLHTLPLIPCTFPRLL